MGNGKVARVKSALAEAGLTERAGISKMRVRLTLNGSVRVGATVDEEVFGKSFTEFRLELQAFACEYFEHVGSLNRSRDKRVFVEIRVDDKEER